MIIDLPDRRPEIADDAWIAASATVVGSVIIGPEVGVWYGAVLRGDEAEIEIGAGSNVQDNCVFHTDPGRRLVLGRDVTVGHGAIVHGAVVGDGVLIGMGAVLMNGCRIGAGSMIGSGAVVSEGVEIPPGSLVLGVPGKVRRETTEEERAFMLDGARGYVERARRHRAGQVRG
jgi:carbonic anhydrase/acetyltransferase-like protein (isoleucine patch superfamily)